MQRVEAWSIGTSSPPMCSSPRRVAASSAILAWPASAVNARCSCRMTGPSAARLSTWLLNSCEAMHQHPHGMSTLALMATELLSGRHPFAGMSVRGAVEAHLDGGAASAAAASALPAPVLAVLCSGLASSAADRPTAGELADRLVDAAPMAWFGATADHAPLVASSPAAPGTYAEDADGLWVDGRQAGWTVELVDDSTWHGSSEAARDGSSLVEASHTSPGSPAIPRSPASKASAATINDKWIRQATPRVGLSSARRRTRTRRWYLGSWASFIAAFVVGFGIVLALVLLRTH